MSTNPRRVGFGVLKLFLGGSKRRCLSTHAEPDMVESDIVIVGGGPAGLALASALGSSPSMRKSLKVTLIESGELSKIKSWIPAPGSFSNRVSSLTNASQTFLRDIGSWESVEESRTCSIEEMQVWDGVSDARIVFSANDVAIAGSSSGMARLTENLNLQRSLLRRLDSMPEIQIHQCTKVISIETDAPNRGGWPLIRLDNKKVLRARLLVGADGFSSPVRAFAKIPTFGWAYNTQAIVATMNHPPRGAYEGPNTTCYQRFLPTGPIAFLPLSPITSSLVWSTKSPLAAALLACDPDVLTSMINAAFRLPDVSMKYLHNRILDAHSTGESISPNEMRKEIHWREQGHAIDQTSSYASALRKSDNLGIPPAGSECVPPLVTELQSGSTASFPLRFNHAESYIGEGAGARTVLVGDAAHTIHPLAGQGLNLGLADVECLARCIQESFLTGGDIGSYTALLPYARERYSANHIMMSATDKLHKLYATDAVPIVWARSVGVEVLNELDSVKAGIMMTAGAQTKRLPRAASAGWNFAGDMVETLATGVKSVGLLKEMVRNALARR